MLTIPWNYKEKFLQQLGEILQFEQKSTCAETDSGTSQGNNRTLVK